MGCVGVREGGRGKVSLCYRQRGRARTRKRRVWELLSVARWNVRFSGIEWRRSSKACPPSCRVRSSSSGETETPSRALCRAAAPPPPRHPRASRQQRRPRRRVHRRVRVVLEVQLGDVVPPHLGPPRLRDVIHCRGGEGRVGGLVRATGQGSQGAGGAKQRIGARKAIAVWEPSNAARPRRGAPDTVPPLAASRKVAW